MTLDPDKEIPGTWRLSEDGKGMTGQRVFLVNEADILSAELPQPDDPWPGPPSVLPYLRCVAAEWDSIDTGDAAGKARCTFHYSTERQLGEDFYEVEMSYGVETLDITKGYTWETAGTPVTDDIPTTIPVVNYTVRVRALAAPRALIVAAENRVNICTFHGFNPGYLRFDGADTSESYDRNGNIISVMTSYRFTGRDRPWNQEWRRPVQDVSADGTPLVWQNKDATLTDTYTVDTTKIGTPVWVAGTAGTGAWDYPKLGSEYRYLTCCFHEVLSLPYIAGDT